MSSHGSTDQLELRLQFQDVDVNNMENTSDSINNQEARRQYL